MASSVVGVRARRGARWRSSSRRSPRSRPCSGPSSARRRSRTAAARAAAAACTVLVDGEPMLSCLLPVEDVDGPPRHDARGAHAGGGLHPIQQAFLDANGYQCGYCTPGMEMVATALLDHNPRPEPRRDRRRARRQRLPLHGLRADRRRDRAAAAARPGRPMTAERDAPRRRRSRSSATTASASSPAARSTAADLTFPGMLHLRMVRSPLHHARIRGVDLSAARAGPGLRPGADPRGRAAQRVHDPRA